MSSSEDPAPEHLVCHLHSEHQLHPTIKLIVIEFYYIIAVFYLICYSFDFQRQIWAIAIKVYSLLMFMHK